MRHGIVLLFRIIVAEIICDCDLTLVCDFNCCCDPDCTNSDKNYFSACISVKSTLEDDIYCTFSKVVQSQDSFHKIEK